MWSLFYLAGFLLGHRTRSLWKCWLAEVTEGCRPFICISQEYLLRRTNLPGKETLGRLVDLAVALEDRKNWLGAPFHLFFYWGGSGLCCCSLGGGSVERGCEGKGWVRTDPCCPPPLPWHSLPGSCYCSSSKQLCLVHGDMLAMLCQLLWEQVESWSPLLKLVANISFPMLNLNQTQVGHPLQGPRDLPRSCRLAFEDASLKHPLWRFASEQTCIPQYSHVLLSSALSASPSPSLIQLYLLCLTGAWLVGW